MSPFYEEITTKKRKLCLFLLCRNRIFWESDDKSGILGPFFETYCASMFFNHMLTKCEPKPWPFSKGLCGEFSLKHLVSHMVWNTSPGVCQSGYDMGRRLPGSNFDPAIAAFISDGMKWVFYINRYLLSEPAENLEKEGRPLLKGL